MQQDGVKSLQSNRESLKEKLCLLTVGRDRSDSVAHILLLLYFLMFRFCNIVQLTTSTKLVWCHCQLPEQPGYKPVPECLNSWFYWDNWRNTGHWLNSLLLTYSVNRDVKDLTSHTYWFTKYICYCQQLSAMMLNLVVVINGLVLVSMTQSLISSYLCD